MPERKKAPMGEMAYATAFVAFQGAAMAWMSLGYQTGYFSWKRATAAVILTSLAAGIWFRVSFARYATIAVLAGGALLILYRMMITDMTMNQLAWTGALLWCCWVIWRGYEKEDAGDTADDADVHRGNVALVALLPEAVALDQTSVSAAAGRAVGDGAPVFGGGMFWAVPTSFGVMRVSSAARPYFSDHSAKTTHSDEHKAVREHNAWVGVELADTAVSDLPAAFALMAKLLNEIAPDTSLAIHAPASNEFMACHEGWRAKLVNELPFKLPATPAPAAQPQSAT
jgi:hypothetical protein